MNYYGLYQIHLLLQIIVDCIVVGIDFVDIDNHFNIDVNKLKIKLKTKVPKILVTVHLGGQPTEQEEFGNSQKYNFYVIEDASFFRSIKK